MRSLLKLIWIAPILMVTTSPSLAIDADLANKCRAMMIKAHPTEVFGSNGSAAAQRAYFQDCVRRAGDMPEASNSGEKRSQTTTGKGN